VQHVELLPQHTDTTVSPNANSDITNEKKTFDAFDIGNFHLNFDISDVSDK